jgi:hypothetical protein
LHQNCAGLVGGGPAGEAKNAASPKAKSAKMAWRSFTSEQGIREAIGVKKKYVRQSPIVWTRFQFFFPRQ